MASQYALNLKATLDTKQVQQELQKLRSAQMATGSGDNGPVGNGQMGLSHLQKIEVQLTKLNSSIAGLQRAIEQLSKSQLKNLPGQPVSSSGKGSSMPSALAPNKPNWEQWLSSKEYKVFNDQMRGIIQNSLNSVERNVIFLRSGAKGLDDPFLAHKIMSNPELGRGIFGDRFDYSKQLLDSQKADYERTQQQKRYLATMRQNRQMATMIGGQLIGGAGELATSFGYNKTGAVLGGIGQGVTAGGSMAFSAALMGAGAAAGPIGLVVGLGAAALAVTKSLNEMNEAAKQAAENQRKVAEALRQTSISQSMERYSTGQSIRAERVRNENNLPVAKENAAYFKNELNKAQGRFFAIQDPKAYEEKIRKEAELKKNSTVDDFYVQGSIQSGFKEVHYQRKRTEEEKAEIDKAANEAIQAHQKKFEAAKKEYQAALQNSKTWEEVADALQQQKDAADKLERETRNQEFFKRRQLRESALVASEAYIQSDRIRSTQIMAMDVLNNKQNGPFEKFSKIADELDRLRADRKSLVEQAYGINKDIAKGGRDSIELADMTKRRDQMLKDASFLAERVGILESALGNISTSMVAPDLSHMTSLAQYGFNMGEKDDTVERMEKYYSKSINLQQQIKDKIEQGIKTEAVYN